MRRHLQNLQMCDTICPNFEKHTKEMIPQGTWLIKRDYADESKFKRYSKKHQSEVVACFANLQRVQSALCNGLTLQQIVGGFGFLRTESEDVYRIAQSAVAHAKETRLYVYIKVSGYDIQVLTIGDKSSQSKDIRWCKSIVRDLKKQEKQRNDTENAAD